MAKFAPSLFLGTYTPMPTSAKYFDKGVYKNAGMAPTAPTYNKFADPTLQNVPSNNPYQVINTAGERLQTAGQEVPEPKQKHNLLQTVLSGLDVLNAPQYMVTNMLDKLTDDKKDSFKDVLTSGLKGLALQEKTSITDTFGNLGWEKSDNKLNNALRFAAGFVGDVALDPTTYLSMGGTVGSKLTKLLSKADEAGDMAKLVAKLGMETAESAAKKPIANALGDIAAKVNPGVGDVISKQGLGVVNKDVMDVVRQGVGAAQSTQIETLLTKAQALGINVSPTDIDALNKGLTSVDKILGKTDTAITGSLRGKLEKTFGITNPGSSKFQTKVHQAVGSVLDSPEDIITPVNSMLYKEGLVKDVLNYKGKVPVKVLDNMTNQEALMINTIVNAFGNTNKLPGRRTILKHMTGEGIGAKTLKEALELKSVGNTLRETTGLANKAFAGIEAAIDEARNRVFLKFAGKPIVEITTANKYAKTLKDVLLLQEPANKIGNTLMEGTRTTIDTINTLFKTKRPSYGLRVQKGMGMGAEDIKKFGSDAWKTIDTKGDFYRNAEKLNKRITEYLHKETSIPKKALSSVVATYERIPQMINDDSLRKIASWYIERNNDDFSKMAWDFISKGKAEGANAVNTKVSKLLAAGKVKDAEMLTAMFRQMTMNPKTLSYYDNLYSAFSKNGYSTELLDEVQSVTYFFHDTLGIHEKTKGIVFKSKEGMNAAARENAFETAEGYLHHGYANNPKTKARNTGIQDTAADKAASKVATKLMSAEERTYSSFAKAMALDPDLTPIDDLFAVTAGRIHESQLVELNKEFAQDLIRSSHSYADMGHIMTTDDKIAAKLGFVKVERGGLVSTAKQMSDEASKFLGEVGDVGKGNLWMAPEMFEELTRITKKLADEDGINVILRGYDKITNYLKNLQTRLNPAFLGRNAIGEPLMNFFGDVSLDSYDDAIKVLQQLNIKPGTKGTTTIGDIVLHGGKPFAKKTSQGLDILDVADFKPGTKPAYNIVESINTRDTRSALVEKLQGAGANVTKMKFGAQEFTAQEVMDIFFSQGLGWSGITKGNLIKTTKQTLKEETKKISGNALQKGWAQYADFGDSVETTTRLTHFIDKLKKGMSIEDAAANVRKFHVDYRDLTNTERTVFRRLAPYYTYLRKNVPMQMRLILTEPGKFNVIGQMVSSSYQALKDRQGGVDIATPDYYDENMALPIGMDEDGNVQYLNWQLPLSDIARIQWVTNGDGRLDVWDSLKEMFGTNVMDMLHPIIKSVLAYQNNSMLSYDAPIEKYEGETTELLPGYEDSPQIGTTLDYALKQLGVLSNVRNTAGSVARAGTGGEQNMAAPNTLNPSDRAGALSPMLKSLLPVKNQTTTKNAQAYSYRDELLDYIQKLKSQGVDVQPYQPTHSYGLPVYKTTDNLERYTPNYRR